MANILICDDDERAVSQMEEIMILNNQSHNIYKAYDGRQALDIISKEQIDLLIIDIMMKVMGGYETIEQIRNEKNYMPIIAISGIKKEQADILFGVNKGADVYLTRPFTNAQLVSNVIALLRRNNQYSSGGEDKEHVFSCGGLVIDDKAKQCMVYGNKIKLTLKEYRILLFLLKNKGCPCSSVEIYKECWNVENKELILVNDDVKDTVSTHIRSIRTKIEMDPNDPDFLVTINGHGYKISCD